MQRDAAWCSVFVAVMCKSLLRHLSNRYYKRQHQSVLQHMMQDMSSKCIFINSVHLSTLVIFFSSLRSSLIQKMFFWITRPFPRCWQFLLCMFTWSCACKIEREYRCVCERERVRVCPCPCPCTCTCPCPYACLYPCLYWSMWLSVCLSVSVSVCLFLFLCICPCLCLRVYARTYVCIRVFIYLCMCVPMCVCVHACMFMCVCACQVVAKIDTEASLVKDGTIWSITWGRC